MTGWSGRIWYGARPTDRRKVIVTANHERLAQVNNVYRSMGDAFDRLHATYTIEQLEFLTRYHQAARELTRQEIAKLATSDASADEERHNHEPTRRGKKRPAGSAAGIR